MGLPCEITEYEVRSSEAVKMETQIKPCHLTQDSILLDRNTLTLFYQPLRMTSGGVQLSLKLF